MCIFQKVSKKAKMALGPDRAANFAMSLNPELAAQFANVKTPNDVRHAVALMTDKDHKFYVKYLYNTYVGWALPTAQVCAEVVRFWQKYPHTRVVDMGAGSGVFCMMLHDAGIPADKLIAIDKNEPIPCYQTTTTFWNIIRDDEFQVPINDIFFMAWGGCGGIEQRLFDYIKRGGWCVIILGEIAGGCTFPSDYLEDDENWNSVLIHVDGPASYYAEHLSINTRKVPLKFYCEHINCWQYAVSSGYCQTHKTDID